jgi:hypothetical protein
VQHLKTRLTSIKQCGKGRTKLKSGFAVVGLTTRSKAVGFALKPTFRQELQYSGRL